MITLIYSKDRAFQLDGCLRSMYQRVPFLDEVVVIAKGTTEEHKESYNILQSEHSDVMIVHETDLQMQTEFLINSSSKSYLQFVMDDDLFFRDVPRNLEMPGRRESVSLRLGENTCNKNHFDYTISLDGNIYRKGEIAMLMLNTTYENPNHLESRLVPYQPNIKQRITEQYLVGIPHNRVSNASGCKFSNKYTTEELLQLYTDGARMQPQLMDFSNIFGPHNYNIEYVYR